MDIHGSEAIDIMPQNMPETPYFPVRFKTAKVQGNDAGVDPAHRFYRIVVSSWLRYKEVAAKTILRMQQLF